MAALRAGAGDLSYKDRWDRFRKGTNRDSEGIPKEKAL
jgi:hypothetical protein